MSCSACLRADGLKAMLPVPSLADEICSKITTTFLGRLSILQLGSWRLSHGTQIHNSIRLTGLFWQCLPNMVLFLCLFFVSLVELNHAWPTHLGHALKLGPSQLHLAEAKVGLPYTCAKHMIGILLDHHVQRPMHGEAFGHHNAEEFSLPVQRLFKVEFPHQT